MLEQRIGFIGAGQMAIAMARGFLQAKLTSPDRLLASDISEHSRQRFAAEIACRVIDDNTQVAVESDVIFLAVKPQHLANVGAALQGRIPTNCLLVSIAAGIRLDTLADWFGKQLRIVRVMPNTPCLVGQGACGFSLGANVAPDDAAIVARLLGALGAAWQLDEKLLDAVTGLAGSGPAFVYVIIEALSDAGVRMGLPRGVAAEMAARTVRGAADMVLHTGEHPAMLKDRVASPGGTTIAGLQALESGGLRAALMAAVEAATRRSRELGGEA